MRQKIFNISAGDSFVDTLAERYLKIYEANPEGLAEVLFLLPNRRACQSLADAFVRKRGLKPTILPQIKPLAEADEAEVLLISDSSVLENLPPAINETDKVLQFTKKILENSYLELEYISLAQAYALARNLSALRDEVYSEGRSFDDIKNIVDSEFAEHWQQTLKLLGVITEYWPQTLRELGLVDEVERRNELLRAELDFWEKTLTTQRIVVAGTTAAFPILKKLVKTVLNLPNGEVYLYGLDKYLSDDDWEKIDENHPQYELKELLDNLQISRNSVENIGGKVFTLREKIVAETFRPAETSSAWRDLTAHPIAQSEFEKIKLVSCDDMRQEAQAIALIIRHTLEKPGKTAALVTMDRNLSRRVVSELQKWNIAADDSAGKPLSLSPIGIYLQLICQFMCERTDTARIALMKHPFTLCGFGTADFHRRLKSLEYCLRKGENLDADARDLYDSFENRMRPLLDLYEQPLVDLRTMFETHIRVAENLADGNDKTGDKIIWKHDAGKVATDWVSEFAPRCGSLGTIKTAEYEAFLVTLLSEQTVRTRYGTHPRVKILGPIEARLTQYDVTIIGGANEGIWPKIPEADMWMSRPMRTQFKLPLPERQIGVAAADFAHLLNADTVYVTRSKKVGKDPTNKSRWWLRFETILEANFGSEDGAYTFIYKQPYNYWAKVLDRREKYEPISAPRPCPKLERRPREMSATNIERWMRNPYEIYAKYVLNLWPLDPLDVEHKPYDYGNIVHDVLKEFNNEHHDSNYPATDRARTELLQLGQTYFEDKEVPPEVAAFWWPKFERQMDWVIAEEQTVRADIKNLRNEIKGEMFIPSPLGPFRIFAKADRIEELQDGTLKIVDYKTGNDSRGPKEIKEGTAPQLPVEAMIAAVGGFKDLPPASVSELQYWSLKNEKTQGIKGNECVYSLEKMEKRVNNLIDEYSDPKRPYLVKPRPGDVDKRSDYDHLSRLDEWCIHAQQED